MGSQLHVAEIAKSGFVYLLAFVSVFVLQLALILTPLWFPVVTLQGFIVAFATTALRRRHGASLVDVAIGIGLAEVALTLGLWQLAPQWTREHFPVTPWTITRATLMAGAGVAIGFLLIRRRATGPGSRVA